MATCPMCNADVENVDEHTNQAHPAEGGAGSEGGAPQASPPAPGDQPQQ